MKKKSEKKSIGRPAIGQRRSLQVSDEDWKRWALAARKAGMTRAEWIRQVCNNSAKITLTK